MFSIGRTIECEISIKPRSKQTRKVKGTIIDDYKNFILVQTKHYKETIPKWDLEHNVIKLKIS